MPGHISSAFTSHLSHKHLKAANRVVSQGRLLAPTTSNIQEFERGIGHKDSSAV